jgi:hypothetical protein
MGMIRWAPGPSRCHCEERSDAAISPPTSNGLTNGTGEDAEGAEACERVNE